ncbi:hypothetical protein [Haladaptatus sp. DFWS20]|uniref:hypothetical protein n=1 Tax=Haladaptatus sp. DFWS20 TaxID=3403467 RepID=UPI003EBA8B2B
MATVFLLLSGYMATRLYHIGFMDAGRGLGGLLLGIIVPAGFGLLFSYLTLTGNSEKQNA